MRSIKSCFIILISVLLAQAAEAIINYSTTTTIQDFLFLKSDSVLVATSGGLYSTGSPYTEGKLFSSSASSPDPLIIALCRDKKGNIWTGSSQGYLTKRTPGGKISLSVSYLSSGWRINGFIPLGKYLVVGSNKGISLFNTETMEAEKNATSFGDLSSSQINVIKIIGDTLYGGLNDGIVKIHKDSLYTANFYDPSIWRVEKKDDPVNSIIRISGKIKGYSGPAILYNGKVLRAEDGDLYYGSTKIFSLPSRVTVLKENGNICWIGTEKDYFYSWDWNQLINYSIKGMSFTYVNKILVSSDGTLWALPRVDGIPWWKAINSFVADDWNIYSPHLIPNMGWMGENEDSRGMAQSPDGRVWFGLSGGHIKCFDPASNGWSRFCIPFNDYGEGKLYQSIDCFRYAWAKCDAIAVDSSGFMWFSVFDSYFGSLICYDPRYNPDSDQADPVKAHYRHFFPLDDPNHSKTFRSLIVDKSGTIFAGGEEGTVIAFRHNGNPLKDGVTVIAAFAGKGKVNDMSTSDDLITRIVTSKGVYEYNPETRQLTEMEGFGPEVTSVEHENPFTIWFGTNESGLIRYNLVNETKSFITTSQGLISDKITDLEIDRANGVLWAGTDLGVSRISLGYKLTSNKSSDILVFPNPFFQARHSELIFRNLPPGSKVLIYTSNGNLLARTEVMREGIEGAYHVWKPERRLAPGTYFYSVQSSGKLHRKGKILIAP
jgi:ligand-binding sensor domain-containing protein